MFLLFYVVHSGDEMARIVKNGTHYSTFDMAGSVLRNINSLIYDFDGFGKVLISSLHFVNATSMLFKFSSGVIEFVNCTFTDCRASSTSMISKSYKMVFTNCSFCRISYMFLVASGSIVEFDSCTFTDISYIFGIFINCYVTIRNSEIMRVNSTFISLYSESTINIQNSSLAGILLLTAIDIKEKTVVSGSKIIETGFIGDAVVIDSEVSSSSFSSGVLKVTRSTISNTSISGDCVVDSVTYCDDVFIESSKDLTVLAVLYCYAVFAFLVVKRQYV